MNHLSSIRYQNYRNLEDQEFDLSDSINVFIGPNGSGKTNILESISLLLPGKGLRKHSLDKITNFKSNNPWTVFCKCVNDNLIINLAISYEAKKNNVFSKKILINGEKQKNTKKLIQIPPIIWFIPEMERLFIGPPSLRRNFIDRITFNFDFSIADLTKKYLKLLNERSNILQKNINDEKWLQNIELNIANLGLKIMQKRNETINILNNTFSSISDLRMDIDLCNLSIINNIKLMNKNDNDQNDLITYTKALQNSRSHDQIRGGCLVGPHKSDLEVVFVKDNIQATFCSTGQQKQIILSILLCQCHYIISNFNTSPIVLFDEICSHLDEKTRRVLLHLTDWLKTQVFITGTNKDLFSFLTTKAKFFNVIKGKIELNQQ